MFSKENGSSNHNFESHLIEGLLGVWPTPEEILTIGFALLALDISSRGSVHPVGPGQLQITADWGSSDDEIDAMISGLVRIRRLLAATLLPWQEIKGDQTPIPVQGLNPFTNQPWADYRHSRTDFKGEILVGNPAAQNLPVLSAFHFVGSLSLGKVVNPQTLQVYGTHAVLEQNNPVPKFEEHEIRGLHVVDSSIIPKIPRTNTMGLTYAVAELASAKILKKEMSVMGDPHFHTWNERWFDFHGECDLVLVNSPQYADGLGLDIHIRTRIRGDYSFIETVAVKIGPEDILEVTGYGGYIINGVEMGDLPGELAGFPVTHEQVNKKLHTFSIDLGDGDKRVVIRSHKDLVSVKVENAVKKDFASSIGLMGSFNTGKLLSRNGTVMDDINDFGNDWQVRDAEPKLFQATDRHPQYPLRCVMPNHAEKESRSRRLGEKHVSREAAEKACANWGSMIDKCVFDVLALDDLEVADAGAF